ncbi:MAG: hypothetical protein MUF25_20525 [Pirellulaceae bacterium]|jgi:hypothetical protein|nr:hypothetical protein [Pirellulaceae bacterium]
MNCTVRLASSFFFLVSVGLLVTLPGCSGGNPTAKVTGKVTHDGQPVTSGNLTFAPVSGTVGKPAAGKVKSDGSYVLSTYAAEDGAVVGRHRVVFSPSSGDSGQEETPLEPGKHAEDKPASAVPFSGLVPKVAEVEVKSGSNEINIELVAAGAAAGAAAPAESAPKE